MSGIYIKNMKMPNFSYREIRIYPDGRVIEKDECGIDEVVGMAQKVQSHGRLIDADALIGTYTPDSYDLNKMHMTSETYENLSVTVKSVKRAISETHTVIPADNGIDIQKKFL